MKVLRWIFAATCCLLLVILMFKTHSRRISVQKAQRVLETQRRFLSELESLKIKALDLLNRNSLASLEKVDFQTSVTRIASRKGFVITPSVIDTGYLDMALNFHITNVIRHGLGDMVLYICVDEAACNEAREYGLPAVLYRNFTSNTGDFNSKTFVKKAMAKIYMMRDVLRMGYPIFLSDLDIIWNVSPLDDVIRACDVNDFIIQNEANLNLNIGFMYIRPTDAAINLLDKVITFSEGDNTRTGAQAIFGRIVEKHKHEIRYEKLPLERYPDGKSYFETGSRTFPQSCAACYIVHNNWIVGVEAKQFRFREHLMWYVDRDGYYSNPHRKYVTYDTSGYANATDDLEALRSALGVAMSVGRTLILPSSFHDNAGRLTQLNGVLLIRPFQQEFKGLYRESSFLQHPFVPASVKTATCGADVLDKQEAVSRHARAATSAEWREAFAAAQNCSVVTLPYMKGKFWRFNDLLQDGSFNGRIKRGFVRGSYRQLDLLYDRI